MVSTRQDIHTRITKNSLQSLNRNTPLAQTLKQRPCDRANHAAATASYCGINIVLLWGGRRTSYSSSRWMTSEQARELARMSRRGTRRTHSVCRCPDRDRDGRDGEEVERTIPFMNGYTVFNVDQIDGGRWTS